MTFPDHYRTLASEGAGDCRVQRSRFHAIAFPVVGEDAFQQRLAAIASEHFDANHHCWAFRLFEGERARSSDAGEPSGSAGRPILQAIERAGLHDAGVVVVRWFGGVKLGTGGLGRAYRDAAQQALAVAPVEDRWIYDRFELSAHHRDANLIYRIIAPPDVVLAGSEFGVNARFDLDVRRSLADRVEADLIAHRIEFKRSRGGVGGPGSQ